MFGWAKSLPPPTLSLPPLPFLPFLFPAFLLEEIQLEGLGTRCKLPSGVWGGTQTERKFIVFFALKSDTWWHQFY